MALRGQRSWSLNGREGCREEIGMAMNNGVSEAGAARERGKKRTGGLEDREDGTIMQMEGTCP